MANNTLAFPPSSWARAIVVTGVIATTPSHLHSQATPSDTLLASFSVDTSRFIPGTSLIEVRLSRAMTADEGDLVLVIGGTDITALAERSNQGIRYQPSVELLPAGTSEIVVYRSYGGAWHPLARSTLRVQNAAGFQRVTSSPQVTLGNKGQLASGETGAPPPPRPTFQDFSLNGTLATQHEHPAFMLETSSSIMGVSRREEALRYGDRQSQAPLIDLADYRALLKTGGTVLTIGHASFGSSRHLVNGFAARGATAAWKRGAAEIQVATLNASASVGWDRLLPINDADHRLTAASLGVDLVPARPGLARLDATWLDGSRQPLAGFTQGAILDSEASQGGSLQLSVASPGQQVRFTGSVSRSRFDNPLADRQLGGDTSLVPVKTERRGARFAELVITPIANRAVPWFGSANLMVTGRHERVDPLYRSVGTGVQADRTDDGVTTQLSLGAVSGQFSVSSNRDNLDDLATLMTTRSRTRSANLSVAVAQLLRRRSGAAWFPMLSWSTNRVHQLGDGGQSGFTPDQVPDQVSRTSDAAAQWQAGRWRLQVRANRAEQDNRQVGRATADFLSGSDAASLGLSLGAAGDVALDVGSDFQESKERGERSTTRRATLIMNLRRGQSTSAVVALSILRTTPLGGPVTVNGEQRLEVTQPLNFLRDRAGTTRGQAFLRFARNTARLPDFALLATDPFAQRDERRWTLASGLNVRLF